MRKRRFYLLLIGVLAVIGVLVAVVSGPREPEYNGVKLSEWVDGLGAADSVRPRVAEEAIRHIGADALPFLLKWIQEKPPWASSLNRLAETVLGQRGIFFESK